MHYFTVEKNQSLNCITDSDDYNESIITAVQARPGLYDRRIPLCKREDTFKKTKFME